MSTIKIQTLEGTITPIGIYSQVARDSQAQQRWGVGYYSGGLIYIYLYLVTLLVVCTQVYTYNSGG